jgi:hypothetical protein
MFSRKCSLSISASYAYYTTKGVLRKSLFYAKMNRMKKGNDGTNLTSKIPWAIVSAIIAACTVYAVIRESGEISPASLWAMVRDGDPLFLTLAFFGMLGYVFFEGAALRCIVNRTKAGAGVTQRHAFVYAAADVYFSAITPSATGGQPASLFFMKRDGLPLSLSSAALVMNLAMYNAAIVVIGIVSIALYPGLFLKFNPLCKALILFGYIVLTGLMIAFLMMLRKGNWIKSIGDALLRLLAKMHLVRNLSRVRQRLDRMVRNYGECADLFLGDKAFAGFGQMIGINAVNRKTVFPLDLGLCGCLKYKITCDGVKAYAGTCGVIGAGAVGNKTIRRNGYILKCGGVVAFAF